MKAQHYGLESAYLGQEGNSGHWESILFCFQKWFRWRGCSDYKADSLTLSLGYVINGRKRYDIKKAALKAPKVETNGQIRNWCMGRRVILM